jgi:hypothetical protein
VADLFAREGTIVDALGTSTDNEFIFRINVSLRGDKVACPVYEKREAHLFFITLGDKHYRLDKHISEHHIDTPIKWACTECEKSFPKLHGARCHIPKCRGPTQISEG